ncbi:substrate-binding domain-containing protein [Flexivirga oryzae]|uniref:Branched-chain amino acid transport system substrate-binding protein n=1 Tax=Flexivirga oryzae TaxID=1794944 RepID=A0A839NE00_9MICO|nr:substrate-binding domain-containing protein [Flexivirga oryzae]MBB2892752.1 branched-chain amino acid transport system substrate-binding protein [Flexivirga oryzae]
MGATKLTVRRGTLMVAVAATAMAMAACGGSSSGGTGGSSGGGSDGSPVKVGMIYSQTGVLAEYGAEYRAGFEAGLKYVTKGTGKVNGHKIDVTWKDDAGDPEKASSNFTTLVGDGYKIIAGSTDSGVASQLAPLAEQNKVLFISGPAAIDSITGANKYTFRSGRQTYQDVKTAAAMVGGDIKGKTVTVLAQDYAFGTANVAAVKAVLGAEGAKVNSVLAPLSAKDFTPYAAKVKQAKPDLLFVAWAGNTTQTMWQTLDQQGVFGMTKVVTGLGNVASYGAYGAAATKVDFLSYYFPGAPKNAVNTAMINNLKAAGKTPDLFSPDGFVAAQMIAQAVTKGDPGNTDSMVSALDGWSFQAPKGKETIRKGDHAMIQPEYVAHLVKNGSSYTPKLVKTVPASELAPPAGYGKS